MSQSRRIARGARLGALPALWGITASLMVRDYIRDPYDPALLGTSGYGHNHQGALAQGLVLTLVELVFVYAILRPPSYDRSWARALGAFLLLLPWTGVWMVLTMHTGGVITIHFLWLASLELLLFVLTIASGLAALLTRRSGEEPQSPSG